MNSNDYNKLVRDNIPKIMQENGQEPIIEILNDDRYKEELDKKLLEEVNEYLKEGTNERLGDIVEVVLALLKYEDSNLGELIEIMDEKREEKGGFNQKIFLKGVK